VAPVYSLYGGQKAKLMARFPDEFKRSRMWNIAGMILGVAGFLLFAFSGQGSSALLVVGLLMLLAGLCCVANTARIVFGLRRRLDADRE